VFNLVNAHEKELFVHKSRMHIRAGLTAAMLLVALNFAPAAAAQNGHHVPAGKTVFTNVIRILFNPAVTPPVVHAEGYLPTIEGIPGLLFAGAPGEATAYFTVSFDASNGLLLPNGDGTSVAVLPSNKLVYVYFNASPAADWNNPASFSAGQLVATFRSTTGTQVNSGPVSQVTQSELLVWSRPFLFKGHVYDFANLVGHGVTLAGMVSNVPLADAGTPDFPLVFAGGGSATALGGKNP